MKKLIFKIVGGLMIVTALIIFSLPAPVGQATTISDAQFKLDKDKLVKYTGTETSVSVPAGIKTIGQEAFADCSHVTSIKLPSGLETIENGAFSGCSALTSIIVPEGVESLGSGAFAECPSLSSVSLPASLIDMGNGVFAGDTSLASVSIAKGNEYFTTEDGAIYNDDKTVLYQVLAGRRGTSFAMPNSVEDIRKYAFWGDINLRQVGLSSHLYSVGDYAFSNASGLVTMSVPFSCRSIGIKAFEDCISLQDILIPVSVTRISPTAFDGCYGINIIADDGTVAARYFEDYKAKEKLREEYEESISQNAVNPHKIIEDGSTDKTTEENKGYVRNPEWAASNVDNYVDWNVDSPGVLGRSKVVSHRAVVFFDSKNASVIDGSDGSVHGGIPDEDPVDASLASIDGRILNKAFYTDDKLNAVYIPEGTKEIGEFSFARTPLKKVYIPNGVTSIDQGAFYHCDDLSEVSVPGSVTYIGPDAFTHTAFYDNWYNKASDGAFLIIGDGILLGYKGGKANVTIPTAVKRIAPYAFKGHDEIAEVSIPDTVFEIGEGAFEDCVNLRNIAGGNKLKEINDRAFYNAPITTVRIPATVESIGQKAFGGTGSTDSVIFMGEKIPKLSYEESATKLYNDDKRGGALSDIKDAVILNDINASDIEGTVLDVNNGLFNGTVYKVTNLADTSDAIMIARSDPASQNASVIKTFGKSHNVVAGNGMITPKEKEDTSLRSLNDLLVVDHSGLKKEEITLSNSGSTVNTNGYHFYISDCDNTEGSKLKKAIEDYYGSVDMTNAFFMDLSMYDPSDTIPVKNMGKNAITLTMPVPANLYSSDFCVISLDDNDLPDVIYPTVTKKEEKSYVSFPVSHCSPYALYVSSGNLSSPDKSGKISNPSGREGLDDTPDTGDYIDPRFILAIGLGALGTALILMGFFGIKDKRRSLK